MSVTSRRESLIWLKKFCDICDQEFELEEELSGRKSILDSVCFLCYEEHNRELDEQTEAKRGAEAISVETSHEN